MKQVRLAFSGSGFLAGIHAGAAGAFLDNGYQIVEIAGTSGGSICAGAVAVGMRTQDLYNLAVRSDMSGLINGGIWSYLRSGGWDRGNALYAYLDKAFGGKTVGQTSVPCQIVSTDVKGNEPFVFSTVSTPDVPLALACRASSAVPFVYAPVDYQGKFLVDGGIMDNMPADRLTIDGIPRYGIDVDSPDTFETEPVWKYAQSLIQLLLSSSENATIRGASQTGAQIIKVPSGGAYFLDTKMTTQARDRLFQAGYNAVKADLPKLSASIGGTG